MYRQARRGGDEHPRRKVHENGRISNAAPRSGGGVCWCGASVSRPAERFDAPCPMAMPPRLDETAKRRDRRKRPSVGLSRAQRRRNLLAAAVPRTAKCLCHIRRASRWGVGWARSRPPAVFGPPDHRPMFLSHCSCRRRPRRARPWVARCLLVDFETIKLWFGGDADG
jgi:hypothetical protein